MARALLSSQSVYVVSCLVFLRAVDSSGWDSELADAVMTRLDASGHAFLRASSHGVTVTSFVLGAAGHVPTAAQTTSPTASVLVQHIVLSSVHLPIAHLRTPSYTLIMVRGSDVLLIVVRAVPHILWPQRATAVRKSSIVELTIAYRSLFFSLPRRRRSSQAAAVTSSLTSC